MSKENETIGSRWIMDKAYDSEPKGAEVVIRLINHGGKTFFQSDVNTKKGTLSSINSGTMESVATLDERDLTVEVEEEDGDGKKKRKKKKFEDVTLTRQGTQVVLPKGMSTRQGIRWLERIEQEDEREVALHHEIHCYPIEGAYALYRALKHKYGFVSLAETPGFWGDSPPVMVGFQVDYNTQVQVPWGSMKIPGIDARLETSGTFKPNGEVVFILSGKVKRKDEDEVNELVALVKKFATSESVFKGKALRVKFPDPENPKDKDFTYTPEFIDVSGVKPEELIFPADVQEMVAASLFTLIEKTELCRTLKVPLKRGILLEGPYGVGKTLAAYVTAKKCVENGWTFMYLSHTADLAKAIQLARNYQPCAIFAEDIDRAIEGEDRDYAMDKILNTIDGIDGKNTEIIVVLTTNDVESINRAMLRPGRLDAVIPVRPPDAAAAARLVLNYSRGLLSHEEPLAEVGQMLAGMIPAVIREVVERAKLLAAHYQPEGSTDLALTARGLRTAAASMQTQLALMAEEIPDERSDLEKAATIMVEGITKLVTPEPAGNGKTAVAELIDEVRQITPTSA
jgi:ATPase family protein associated with various cellular activities (AAA)